jgi:hypothetical protein
MGELLQFLPTNFEENKSERVAQMARLSAFSMVIEAKLLIFVRFGVKRTND